MNLRLGVRRVTFVLALPLFLSTGSGLGQTAKQGDPAQVTDPHAFHSPMVLETSFAAGDRSLWKDNKEFTLPEWEELGKFRCDGVALRGDHDEAFFWNRPKTDGLTGFPSSKWEPALKMKVHDLPGGVAEIRLSVAVNNPKKNHDKRVSLLLEVVNGDEVVGKESVSIKAEDDGVGHSKTVKWTIPASSLRPTTKLRITMTTKDY